MLPAVFAIAFLAILAPAGVVDSFVPAQHLATPSSTDADGDGLTDSFEIRYHLDPKLADSDEDGLPDGAEDLDNDGLSNLGEQRYGTNPRLSDSDRDGIADADDDSDRDGVADGLEQDHRPVPHPLSPTLLTARDDWRCYRPGAGSTNQCRGDVNGTIKVVLYGDSHAGQWSPTLDIVAKHHHWLMQLVARSGCPSVHVPPTKDATDNARCDAWRAHAEDALRAHPPQLIIITNLRGYGTSRQEWHDGLLETLRAMPRESEVVVLADTPKFKHDVPVCLRYHDRNMGYCEVPRSVGLKAKHDAIERSAATAAGDRFISMNAWVCPYELCPVVVDHVLMWRDRHHMTVTFAKSLHRALYSILRSELSGTAPAPNASLLGRAL